MVNKTNGKLLTSQVKLFNSHSTGLAKVKQLPMTLFVTANFELFLNSQAPASENTKEITLLTKIMKLEKVLSTLSLSSGSWKSFSVFFDSTRTLIFWVLADNYI
jgi:hypothetical protein